MDLDESTLKPLFRKLKSLEDLKVGQLLGEICTVIDLANRLPVEAWFHTNPAASETNFEALLDKSAITLTSHRCPGRTSCRSYNPDSFVKKLFMVI